MDWCSDRQSSVSYLIFPIEHHPDALSVESLAHTHPSVVNITHKLGVEWGGGERGVIRGEISAEAK